MASLPDDHFVILVCRIPDEDQPQHETQPKLLLSTEDLLSWEPPAVLHQRTVTIKVDRRRLIEHSSYFHGLLGGSFSESRQGHISIKWNLEIFISVLKCIYGCPLDISSKTLLPLLEAGLYFGVEALLVKCENWFSEVASSKESGLHQVQLDDLIHIWNFSSHHALHFPRETVLNYLAKNFMHAVSCESFIDIPCTLLVSCLGQPHVTVDSEMHLAEALLIWVDHNMKQMEHDEESQCDFTDVLKHIRISLLPLSFAAGKRRSCNFSELADQCIQWIHRLKNPSVGLMDLFGNGDFSHLRARLTEYSEAVNLSGCPQITAAVLVLSLLPYCGSMDPLSWSRLRQRLLKLEGVDRDRHLISWQLPPVLSFAAVQQVDVSKCSGLKMEAAMECFSKSFPSLRILKAAYLVNFNATSLPRLLEKCPLLSEIDLTHDLSPLVLAQVSATSPSSATNLTSLHNSNIFGDGYLDMTSPNHSGFSASNITRLTLEGQSDVFGKVIRELICKRVRIHSKKLYTENMARASITKGEALLRASAVFTLVLAACLIGKDRQTKAIVYTYTKTATYKDLDALMIAMYVDAAAAAYSVLQLSRCSISAWFHRDTAISYDQKNLAWVYFLLDQAVVYIVFAANSAALQAALLAVTGSKALQWMKLCNRYTRFCFQIGGSLVCGYVASFLLVVVSCMSAFNLFRLYSPTRFMQLKRK